MSNEWLKRIVRRVTPPKVLGAVRTWRGRRLIHKYPNRNVRHTYAGVPLTVHLADATSASWYDFDWPLMEEIEVLRRRQLRPGAKVFDIGAHQGIVAHVLAKQVEPDGVVIAVEAQPHNMRVLEENIRLNGTTNIQTISAAAAEEPGTIYFNSQVNGAVDSSNGALGRTLVRAVTLDGLTAEHGRPDVVFIDTEGYELRILGAGRSTLAMLPDFFIEVHVGKGLEAFGGTADRVVSEFPPSDYEVLASPGPGHPFAPVQPGAAVTRSRFFLLALARRPYTLPATGPAPKDSP